MVPMAGPPPVHEPELITKWLRTPPGHAQTCPGAPWLHCLHPFCVPVLATSFVGPSLCCLAVEQRGLWAGHGDLRSAGLPALRFPTGAPSANAHPRPAGTSQFPPSEGLTRCCSHPPGTEGSWWALRREGLPVLGPWAGPGALPGPSEPQISPLSSAKL